MQFKSIAAAALLAASVSAYEVLTPTLNSTVAKGETVSIEWTSVDTDAEVFSVYLTNFATAHWPPTVLSLAQNVPREDGSIELRIPCDVSSDYGWQINFINGTNTYVIYAQSPAFTLTGDCVEPEPTTSSSSSKAYPTYVPTGTGYTNTTTKTVGGTTATATLCKTVSTIIYATPIVWFVEPSHEAVCDYVPAKPTATVTVTVTKGEHGVEYPTGGSSEGGEGGHGYPTGGEGGASYPTKGGAGYPTGGAEGPSYPSYTTIPEGHASATGTGGYVAPTKGPEFTGAASSVKVSGGVAMMIGAIAFLL